MPMRSFVAFAAFAVAAACTHAQDPAASYPSRTIRIFGQGTGSTADYLSRYLALKLTERWGQPVIVDSRAGAGGDLATTSEKVTGIPLQHIPYKSAGNALTAVLAGEVPVSFLSPLTAHGQLKAGKVKALAVSSSTRFPGAPDIPSAVEAGIPGMEVKLWFGLFATGKTPRAIVAKLNREIGDILRAPETQETFLKQGVAAAPGSPEELGDWV